jgi:hypothetical protein
MSQFIANPAGTPAVAVATITLTSNASKKVGLISRYQLKVKCTGGNESAESALKDVITTISTGASRKM